MSMMNEVLSLPDTGMGRPMSLTVSDVLNDESRVSWRCCARRRKPAFFSGVVGVLLSWYACTLRCSR